MLKEKGILITVKALVFTLWSEQTHQHQLPALSLQRHSFKQQKVLIRMELQSFVLAPPSSLSQPPPKCFCSGLKRFIASSSC